MSVVANIQKTRATVVQQQRNATWTGTPKMSGYGSIVGEKKRLDTIPVALATEKCSRKSGR